MTGCDDGFSLTDLVRDVCSTSTSADPAVLTGEVLRRIVATNERAALEQALGVFVRRFVSRDHRPIGSPSSHVRADNHSARAGGGPRQLLRSRKVHGIRTWQDTLAARVNIGPKLWKRFGDCDSVDLKFMICYRESLAAANSAEAQKLRVYAELLAQYGVEKVRDLPESAIGDLGEEGV